MKLIHEMLGCIYAHLVLEVGLCDWDKSFHISYLYMENNLQPLINQKCKIKRNFWTIFMIFPSLSLVKYFSDSFLWLESKSIGALILFWGCVKLYLSTSKDIFLRHPYSFLDWKNLNIWMPSYKQVMYNAFQDESINWPNLLKVLDMEQYI